MYLFLFFNRLFFHGELFAPGTIDPAANRRHSNRPDAVNFSFHGKVHFAPPPPPSPFAPSRRVPLNYSFGKFMKLPLSKFSFRNAATGRRSTTPLHRRSRYAITRNKLAPDQTNSRDIPEGASLNSSTIASPKFRLFSVAPVPLPFPSLSSFHSHCRLVYVGAPLKCSFPFLPRAAR